LLEIVLNDFLSSNSYLEEITSFRGELMGKSTQLLLRDKKDESLQISELLEQRRSKELIIAFCGPAGSGIKNVVEAVKNELETTYKYEVEEIKVSNLIRKHIKKVDSGFNEGALKDPSQRYLKLQDAGNTLRKSFGNDILGQLAVAEIGLNREKRRPKKSKGKEYPEDDRYSHRSAYLIDSLKHPDEVNILRAVYRNMFYMIGIFCPADIRRKNLAEEDIKPSDAELIMERDKKQDDEFGQQLMHTLQYADFFINTNHPVVENGKIRRFLDLILDTEIISPSVDEYAMYVAQSAALRSGCLSRQIGAVIVSEDGEIISTGYNDVPKKGGGLYSSEDGDNDLRCVRYGNECRSHKFKEKMKKEIYDILVEELDVQNASSLAEKIAGRSRIKDIIEFSRAVHAEMEAIISAARMGLSTKNGTLYCTTFPCHNCARHIVAAGIKKVFFIEPYEKSLALKLHGEDILLEPSSIQKDYEEVVFTHFEGVAPRQYLNLFRAKMERKNEGKGIIIKPEQAIPALPEYLDPWTEVEIKVIQLLKEKLGLD
jgi:deoxycytidylate deaminase